MNRSVSRSRRLLGIALSALGLVIAQNAYSLNWQNTTGTPIYLPATGHYYQSWHVVNSNGESFSWDDAAALAASLSYNGFVGYPATLTSAAEAQIIESGGGGMHFPGYIGAVYEEGSGWFWATGPEAGDPVVFQRPAIAPGSICEPPPVGLYGKRIVPIGNGYWYITPTSFTIGGSGPPASCAVDNGVLVEYGGLPTATSELSWGRVKGLYR